MTSAKLPGSRAALVDQNGVMTPAFYRYFAEQDAGQATSQPSITAPDSDAINLSISAIQDELARAKTLAFEANAQLQAIARDNILSPSEKPVVIRDKNVILTEQTGIDEQADAFSIITEKTAYDDAISALTTYLAGLVAPIAWNDLSGNTDIDGPTFRAKFADVYTTRQTLLNAIYAAAKAKADAAQDTANTANTNANKALDQLGNLSNSQYLQNPFFTTGDLTGWAQDSGWAFERGSNGPASASTSYAVHTGSSAHPDSALRNSGKIPVYPGAVIKAQCAVRGYNSPDGTCGVRISWRDGSDTEISTVDGNKATGNATFGTYVTGTAPTGAAFAHVECAAYNHTTGNYSVDNFAAWALADTLDQVPDSSSRFASIHDAAKQTGIYTPGANLVINPSGALGFSNWSQVSARLGAAADPNAPYFRFTGNTGDVTASNIVVGAGLSFILSADMFTGGLTSGNFFCVAACFNSSNVYLGVQCQLSPPTGVASFTRYTSAPITTPANTAYIQVHAFLSGATNTNSAIRRIKLELGSTATPFNDDATQYGNQLTVPGSGQQIGDQLNAPSSLTRNLGIVRSATALTAHAGGAVDINAHTITMGGAQIAYSAKSNAVTGLTTSSSYYIYTRDNYAGGSPTWGYSTDSIQVNSWDDAYNAGVVTIPTSGSSGGGGGGGGIDDCVGADMWLRRGLTARMLAERWRWWRPCILRGQDGWHFVRQRPRVVQQPCCRITVADGSTLDCSNSTPVNTATGESVLAPMLHGHFMWTDSGWQRVINVELLAGKRDVVHISVGGHTILAGACWWRRLSTHNLWKK